MAINRVGPPVRGEDLFGRDKFVELLWRKLSAGNVLLAAPRRFGKTSVMYRLIDQPRENYKIVHADLEHLSEPADLVLELIVKLASDPKTPNLMDGVGATAKELWGRLRNTFNEVEAFTIKLKLKEEIAPHWQESGKQLLTRVGDSGQPVLFILDEFPMMIDRMARLEGKKEEARALLRWLRALRISPELKNVRFLIAGSIGISAVLNQIGEIATINDFEPLRLDPFSPAIADRFLIALAASENIDLSPECRKAILDHIGIGVPYFLQILFSEISKSHHLDDEAITIPMIEKVYRTKVLGVDCKTYFDHYYGRLRDYYLPQEEKAVKKVLRELARTGALNRNACFGLYSATQAGEGDIESFNAMLSNLENDFYIRYNTETDQYEMACKLLRDWWLRHYAMEAI
jgi:hypothetical protein